MSDNVKLVVEGREVVELHLNDRGINEIDDSSGEGSLNSTWSADKLFNLFKELNINNEDVIELLKSKVDKQDGMGLSESSFTLEEKEKLLGIAVGATRNALDSFLLDRGNHTNTQPQNTVEGLVERLNTIEDSITSLGGDNESLVEELLSLRQDVVLNSTNISTLTDRVGDINGALEEVLGDR